MCVCISSNNAFNPKRFFITFFGDKERGEIPMQFIDLNIQQKRIRAKIEKRIQMVLDHGQYIMGPEVKSLETVLSQYVGVKHGLACASGTDALLLALMAYDVRPGDVILTTPFTFMATAEVIALLQATPVFVDIDPATFNMDPEQLRKAIKALETHDAGIHPLPQILNRRLFPHPRGIIPVDLFGLPADYESINALAKEYDLFVIEDAAQSFGAESLSGKACSLAHIGCTSFFPAKPLGAYGDGGMCFTDNTELQEKMLSLRVHGQGRNKYENLCIGINGRLDTLQAAILLEKFEIFPDELQKRRKVAHRYNELLKEGNAPLTLPKLPPGVLSAWAQYSVLARSSHERSSIQEKLRKAEIPTAIYYPTPLHLQPAYGFLGYSKGDFPVSEACADRIFSLPMHPYLTEDEQRKIASVICDEP
jgi:dTDP-4-amino-4,6-dideoxygalactose transaminase